MRHILQSSQVYTLVVSEFSIRHVSVILHDLPNVLGRQVGLSEVDTTTTSCLSLLVVLSLLTRPPFPCLFVDLLLTQSAEEISIHPLGSRWTTIRLASEARRSAESGWGGHGEGGRIRLVEEGEGKNAKESLAFLYTIAIDAILWSSMACHHFILEIVRLSLAPGQ